MQIKSTNQTEKVDNSYTKTSTNFEKITIRTIYALFCPVTKVTPQLITVENTGQHTATDRKQCLMLLTAKNPSIFEFSS